jgi:hypothetical protein
LVSGGKSGMREGASREATEKDLGKLMFARLWRGGVRLGAVPVASLKEYRLTSCIRYEGRSENEDEVGKKGTGTERGMGYVTGGWGEASRAFELAPSGSKQPSLNRLTTRLPTRLMSSNSVCI